MDRYVVFDIGGSHIKYGLLTSAGEIIENGKTPTPDTLPELLLIFDEYMNQNLKEISGVAISSPGQINIHTGEIFIGGALPYLHKFNVKDYFRKNYDLPATVVNDGKAAGQAELWKGNLRGVRNAASLTLGTGIGGAIIVDGKVVQGTDFLAGELSSIYLDLTEGAPQQTLSLSNSAVLFIKRMAKIIGLEDDTDGEAVFDIIISGENQKVNQEFKAYCRRLVMFMSNLQMILDISHVAIGGGISEQPILIEELKRQYEIIRNKQPGFAGTFRPLIIDKCKYSNNSNLIGALYQLLLEENRIEIRV